MPKFTPRLALFVAITFATAHGVSIGNTLVRTYTKYVPLPVTAAEAEAAGWSVNSLCDPNLGIAYNQNGGPTEDQPMTLYYTPAGQAAGINVQSYGSVKQPLIDAGYWIQVVEGKQYEITVTFRNQSVLCSDELQESALGDQLVINQGTLNHQLPIYEEDAVQQQWIIGSCFEGMGHHYFYDLATPGTSSWISANLLPVVMMYDQGFINAFFFATTTVQQSITSAHDWEPIPLNNLLMCKNWCNKQCDYTDTYFFSTLHIYLQNYTMPTCAGGCTIGCCP